MLLANSLCFLVLDRSLPPPTMDRMRQRGASLGISCPCIGTNPPPVQSNSLLLLPSSFHCPVTLPSSLGPLSPGQT
ncbi:hypothetical protein B0H10DRAFT_2128361, partial [Mycena sp. CBHHK59/15]